MNVNIIGEGMVLTWEELAQYDVNAPTSVLVREPKIEACYQEHRRKLQESGTPIEKYIACNVMRGEPICITVNEFPYLVADGIQHLVLWMLPGYEMNADAARKYIQTKKETEHVILFENVPNNRSIKGLAHYQVFVRTLI